MPTLFACIVAAIGTILLIGLVVRIIVREKRWKSWVGRDPLELEDQALIDEAETSKDIFKICLGAFLLFYMEALFRVFIELQWPPFLFKG